MTTRTIIAILAISGFFGACASSVQAPTAKLDKNQLKMLVSCRLEGGGTGKAAPVDEGGGTGKAAPTDGASGDGSSDVVVVTVEKPKTEGGGTGKALPTDGSGLLGTEDLVSEKLMLAMPTSLECKNGYSVAVEGVARDAGKVSIDIGNGDIQTVDVGKDGTFNLDFDVDVLPQDIKVDAESI